MDQSTLSPFSPCGTYVGAQAGADKDHGDEQGNTPIWVAAKMGQAKAVRLLLKANADKNLCNNNRTTPIWVATKHDQFEALRLLLEAGADAQLPNITGKTPLQLASHLRRRRIVRLLQPPDLEMAATTPRTS